MSDPDQNLPLEGLKIVEPTDPDSAAVSATPIYYVNSAQFAHSTYEFIITLSLNLPTGTSPACRVIMSPAHVKLFARFLQKHMAVWENENGPAPVPEKFR